ncbi:haloacid dehalogenase type II [Mycobacterium sp. PS03-16]|uniref:haloacid dehalogenase type II n=1 Tax=Mycobacterium sp. PS03-16 TaxID=2559611 RepID=UPI00107404FC|nr:haloacid dehalogenase type II [Mycobacterium sp. PS03-16]TFV61557.1 haloacid dehalogenase type II [Mycobacterium sp. PS03-16]
MPETAEVLVFDVNETLLDIESLTPYFAQTLSDPGAMREWFGQLVMHSMAVTLSGNYVDFSTLGRAVLAMLADVRGVTVTEADLEGLTTAIASMPAHPDVAEGLEMLRTNGFRLVTLTNSPPHPSGRSGVDRAGMGEFFERQFSVDSCRAFKPDQAVYRQVLRSLDVPPERCLMVAAHMWDTIGAQAVGMRGAFIRRPGNAVLDLAPVPHPDMVATDLIDLARQLSSAR